MPQVSMDFQPHCVPPRAMKHGVFSRDSAFTFKIPWGWGPRPSFVCRTGMI